MIEPLVVIVRRHDVEAGNTASTLRVLSRLLAGVATVREYRERVDIAFQGYDTDSRELFEIPEVRRFVAALDDSFPYWLYFLVRFTGGHAGCRAEYLACSGESLSRTLIPVSKI